MWGAEVPSKVGVFAWKVVNNGLPTRRNKQYRHLKQEYSCELCGHSVEDVFRAVISCPHARALRGELRKKVAHQQNRICVIQDQIGSLQPWTGMMLNLVQIFSC